MSRQSYTFCLLALVAVPSAAQTGGSPTPDTVFVDLPGVVARALSVSPDILAQQAQSDFADARLDEALGSRILPEFSLTSAHAVSPGIRNPNGTPNDRLYLDPDVRNDWGSLSPFSRVDISMIQPLWTWGQLRGLIGAARAGRALEEGGLSRTRHEVARRSAALYYAVVLSDELERLALQADRVIKGAETEIDSLLEDASADVGEADLFQLRITAYEIRGRQVEVRESSQTARMALRRQLMLPESTVVMARDRTLEPAQYELEPLDSYLERGLRSRPELSQVQAGVTALRSLVQVARSDFYPKLFWGVSAAYSGAIDRHRQRNPYVGDPFLTRSLETGLGVRMKLNFRQTRARVQQAEARVEGARQTAEGAKQLIQVEVEQAYRKVVFRLAAVEAAEGALQESKEWLRFEQVNYDLDFGDIENLIKAVKANLELQAARHQAVYELNIAYLDFFHSIGEIVQVMAH